MEIQGNPLGSVIGAAGAGAIAVGLGGLTLILRTAINEGARWAIKLVASGKVERDRDRGRLRLKPGISVSQTLLGTLWGLLAGVGSLATLQETATSLPTIELALQLVLPFALVGLAGGSLRLTRQQPTA